MRVRVGVRVKVRVRVRARGIFFDEPIKVWSRVRVR